MMNTQIDTSADQFAERVFGSILGALDTWAIFIGDKMGLYRALADQGPLTAPRLAQLTGMHPRYALEWLEQQVVSGVLTVDDASVAPDRREFSLPDGHSEVLTDADSLAFLAPFVRLVVAGGTQMPALVDAYRSGGGVSWAEFGDDMRTGQAEMNRPWFVKELGSSWFPSVPELHDKLLAGSAVADIGCGEGWSSIAIATSYPNCTVDGYDIDRPSVMAARGNARSAGVEERARFSSVDAAVANPGKKYDVVTAFECIHDMPDPVNVLRSMRDMVADDGVVVVMDEAVGDAFGERFDDVERLMYGFSLFVCLPDGMSHQPSVGTGTVMRRSILEGYAIEAGFSGVDVLPIDNELWRFYQLNA